LPKDAKDIASVEEEDAAPADCGAFGQWTCRAILTGLVQNAIFRVKMTGILLCPSTQLVSPKLRK
jgi:hypothetical protein